MEAFLIGVVFGLSITISVGPGFIAMFQTSISRGPGAGFVFAAGMLLSDLSLVSICYFGLSGFILRADTRIVGLAAGLILIVMGLFSLFRSKAPVPEQGATRITGLQGVLLIKGYLINIANPFSLIFWLGVVGFAAKNWGPHDRNFFLLFTGLFLTAFLTDLVKCYLSGLLRKVVVSVVLHRINRVMGLVIIGIGLYLIFKVRG